MQVIHEIMELADLNLGKTGLNYALVVWKPGCPNGVASTSVSSNVLKDSGEVANALCVAAKATILMKERA